MGCGVSTSREKPVEKTNIFDINEGKKASNNAVIKQYIQYSNRVRRSTMTPSKTLNESTNKVISMGYDEHKEQYKIPFKEEEVAKNESVHEVPSISEHSQLAENGLSEEEKTLVSKLQPGYMRKDVTGVSAVLSVFEDDKGIAVTTANGTSQNKTLKICRWLDRVLAEESEHGNKFFNPELPEIWPPEIREVSNTLSKHSTVRDYHNSSITDENKINKNNNIDSNYYNNINTNYENYKYANDTSKQNKYNDNSEKEHVNGTESNNDNTNYTKEKKEKEDYRYNNKVCDTNRNNVVEENNEIDNSSDTNGSYDSSSSNNSSSNNTGSNNNNNNNKNNKFDSVKAPNYNRGAHLEEQPICKDEEVDDKHMRRWDQDEREEREDVIDKKMLRRYEIPNEYDDIVQIN